MTRQDNGDKQTIEIILQHGWGFDSSCFRSWLKPLRETPSGKIIIQTPDRGYFGQANPVKPFSKEATTRIVVAHSLGLHLLPLEILQSADLLVLASAFRHFHGGGRLEQKRSTRTVQLMLTRLEESPLDVLDSFYTSVYHPLFTSWLLLSGNVKAIDVGVLVEDLNLLNTNEFDLGEIAGQSNILLVHGLKDIVVPVSRACELNEFLPTSSLILFEEIGHSLPLTHVEPLWQSMRNSLKRLMTVNA